MTASIHNTPQWRALSRKLRPRIEAALPMTCVMCGNPVFPGSKWDLGHILDAATYPDLAFNEQNLGPQHRSENRRAGQRLATNRNNQRQTRPQTPTW